MSKNKNLLFLPAPKSSGGQKLFRFWRWLPSIFLVLLLAILLAPNFWPQSELDKALRDVRRWPQLPFSHLALSRQLFLNGQEALSYQELSLAKKQLQKLSFLSLDRLFWLDEQKTQTLVGQKKLLEDQLKEADEQLGKYPYSWPLWLNKAIVAYRLYRFNEAQEAINLAYWLNPGESQILAVKKAIDENRP